ncbi:MAG: GGDEF domain-containing protein, partial [Cytophagales bacterium]|nr:GGDEF domain-containing protein [Cytophagales bacterium]
NDTYGHQAGDMIIRQFSKLLRDHIREGDYAVRWGGEEFVLIFRPIPEDQVRKAIERIHNAIEQFEFSIGPNKTIQLTASIGFSQFPFFNDDFNRLSWEHTLEIADQALYHVKTHGRNGWATIRRTETTQVSQDILFTIKDSLINEVIDGKLELETSPLTPEQQQSKSN